MVGLLARERGETQRLIVDVELVADLEESAGMEHLSRSVDYKAVADVVTFLLQHCRFRTLETAAHVLLKYLLALPARGEARAQIQCARVSLRKPGVQLNRHFEFWAHIWAPNWVTFWAKFSARALPV